MRAASVSKQAMSYVLAEIFLISLLPFKPELESKEPFVVSQRLMLYFSLCPHFIWLIKVRTVCCVYAPTE